MIDLCFHAGKLTFADLHLTGEDTVIRDSRFDKTVFIHCFFDKGYFCNNGCIGSLFADSSFVDTVFSNDTFFGTVFDRCNFNGATFSDFTKFYDCRFYNCIFNLAQIDCFDNMFNCNFDGCDFRNAVVQSDLIPGRVYARDCIDMPYLPMVCPEEGSFTGYKIAFDGDYPAMVKLTIPADAKRSSGRERKCRCDKAFVEEIISIRGPFSGDKITAARSDYDSNFFYRVGQMVGPVANFEENRWITCAAGIHFFLNKKEALRYYGLLKEDNNGRQ